MYITKNNYPIDPEKQSLEIPNSDGTRQSTLTPEGATLEYVFEEAKTLIEGMERGHKTSDNGPCLGWRDSDSEYKWLSYKEVIEKYQNISYGLLNAGMKKGQESFVGIYSQNCVEWVLVEYACYCQSAVVVPLYDTLGPSACTFILNHVDAEFLLCDTEKKVKSILDTKESIPKLRHIIVIQEVGEEVKQLAAQKEITLCRLKDIEESGKNNPDSLKLPSPSDVATVCFTSGTTGNPKGVILTHRNMIACASGMIKHVGVDLYSHGERYLSYLPMAHMLDRMGQAFLYSTGGAVGFFRGDLKLLLDDIATFKPTMLAGVPTILNRIYDKVQSELQSNPLKKFLFDVALRAKRAELERGTIRNNSMWDRLILKNIRNIFGGKLKLLVTAGAPIRDDVLSFLRYTIGCVVVQAYGQTECTAGCNMSVIGDYEAGNVGPPLPCAHIKLTDVPDMGYFAKNGEGEILVKGPSVSKGYYKDPVKTAEVLDDDGWLHTGDIGSWKKNGSLSVIDRKKNLLKLSQGEYISPEKIEAVYLGCPFIDQIFIHGESLENCLVAIAVPEKETLTAWCLQQNIQGEWEELCENEDVKGNILKELVRLGGKAGLKGFEQVKAIHLYPNAFNQEDGLLTVTMKFKRSDFRKRFQEVIQKMYDSLR